MFNIESVSFTPDVIDAYHQSVMLYKVVLEQAKKETDTDEQAYDLADHVFQNLLRIAKEN